MPSLISHVADQRRLLDELNYLNMGEIRAFCDKHGIPYRIFIESAEGRRRTGEIDRKGVLLGRVRHYLETGTIQEATCFPSQVVSAEKSFTAVKGTLRVLHGQYSPKNLAMMTLLKQLTAGQFKDGAIARILLNQFWRAGTAPTCKEFAERWLQAQAEHARPNPEWAFLADRSAQKDTADWKQSRAKTAVRVLAVLESVGPRTG